MGIYLLPLLTQSTPLLLQKLEMDHPSSLLKSPHLTPKSSVVGTCLCYFHHFVVVDKHDVCSCFLCVKNYIVNFLEQSQTTPYFTPSTNFRSNTGQTHNKKEKKLYQNPYGLTLLHRYFITSSFLLHILIIDTVGPHTTCRCSFISFKFQSKPV